MFRCAGRARKVSQGAGLAWGGVQGATQGWGLLSLRASPGGDLHPAERDPCSVPWGPEGGALSLLLLPLSRCCPPPAPLELKILPLPYQGGRNSFETGLMPL